MPFDLPDLEALERLASGATGTPLQLPLADIDEDPGQPRHEFDAESLQELAATIAAGGVRQPVSVRVHPTDAGRWMLNFGARRLRASRLAGKAEIPAFVDAVFDSYDQVIENEQREPLRPLELALFVERRLAAGDSRADIARKLGKSRGYLTFVGALIRAPEFLLELYRSGRCTGLNELYELRKLHETRGEEVECWARAQRSVSREDVAQLKAALGSASAAQPEGPGAIAPTVSVARDDEEDRPRAPLPTLSSARAAATPPAKAKVVLQALYGEQEVWIDLTSAPAEEGKIFVRDTSSRAKLCVAARDLRLLRVCRI